MGEMVWTPPTPKVRVGELAKEVDPPGRRHRSGQGGRCSVFTGNRRVRHESYRGWPETGEIVALQLKREMLLERFANRSKCLIGMEACGGSQHWARSQQKLGHDGKLLSDSSRDTGAHRHYWSRHPPNAKSAPRQRGGQDGEGKLRPTVRDANQGRKAIRGPTSIRKEARP
jgi:hypothetical protein